MLSALNVLHQKQIIHRDLKSANIFITQNTYKIADLNVSKLLKHSLAYTQTGTPYYASPEVWQDKPYELKSDIWSLGCILYETAALRPPFTATSMDGLYKKVLFEDKKRLWKGCIHDYPVSIHKDCRNSFQNVSKYHHQSVQEVVNFLEWSLKQFN